MCAVCRPSRDELPVTGQFYRVPTLREDPGKAGIPEVDSPRVLAVMAGMARFGRLWRPNHAVLAEWPERAAGVPAVPNIRTERARRARSYPWSRADGTFTRSRPSGRRRTAARTGPEGPSVLQGLGTSVMAAKGGHNRRSVRTGL